MASNKLVFEQGAMDSLSAAHAAIIRAIEAYDKCREGQLTFDEGPLFEAVDNVDTVFSELADFRTIIKPTPTK